MTDKADDSTTLREPLENRPRDLYSLQAEQVVNDVKLARAKDEVCAAALAWREADETNASQRCDELIAACDRYEEARKDD